MHICFFYISVALHVPAAWEKSREKKSRYAKEKKVEVPVLCTGAYLPTSSTGCSGVQLCSYVVVAAGQEIVRELEVSEKKLLK